MSKDKDSVIETHLITIATFAADVMAMREAQIHRAAVGTDDSDERAAMREAQVDAYLAEVRDDATPDLFDK